MNYKFVIQYDGTKYSGWQKQGNTDRTIQGKLEAVLEKLAGEPVEVHGSGRTDAGAHACGQAANAHFHTERSCEQIRDFMNRYLPQDIAVLEVRTAHHRFHSRLNATEKTYCYRIHTGPVRDVFTKRYTHHMAEEFDLDAMRTAAASLIGTHDFTSFCGNRRFKKSPVRTLSQIRIEQKGQELQLWFSGDGFLQNMVRIITGTLVEVGTGKRPADSMTDILEAKNRDAAGAAVPAQGLTLMSVSYEK